MSPPTPGRRSLSRRRSRMFYPIHYESRQSEIVQVGSTMKSQDQPRRKRKVGFPPSRATHHLRLDVVLSDRASNRNVVGDRPHLGRTHRAHRCDRDGTAPPAQLEDQAPGWNAAADSHLRPSDVAHPRPAGTGNCPSNPICRPHANARGLLFRSVALGRGDQRAADHRRLRPEATGRRYREG